MSTGFTVAGFAIAALVAFSSLNSYQVASQYAEQYPDAYGAARAQARMAPLLERVPANARIGYITDLAPDEKAHMPALLAAQYALAPRQLLVIGVGPAPELAVGNFARPADYVAAGAAKGYELTADLGNGVVLYHRKRS